MQCCMFKAQAINRHALSVQCAVMSDNSVITDNNWLLHSLNGEFPEQSWQTGTGVSNQSRYYSKRWRTRWQRWQHLVTKWRHVQIICTKLQSNNQYHHAIFGDNWLTTSFMYHFVLHNFTVHECYAVWLCDYITLNKGYSCSERRPLASLCRSLVWRLFWAVELIRRISCWKFTSHCRCSLSATMALGEPDTQWCDEGHELETQTENQSNTSYADYIDQ